MSNIRDDCGYVNEIFAWTATSTIEEAREYQAIVFFRDRETQPLDSSEDLEAELQKFFQFNQYRSLGIMLCIY